MSNPVITITMENGDVMKGELYPEIAPNTVNNFISLANKHFQVIATIVIDTLGETYPEPVTV